MAELEKHNDNMNPNLRVSYFLRILYTDLRNCVLAEIASDTYISSYCPDQSMRTSHLPNRQGTRCLWCARISLWWMKLSMQRAGNQRSYTSHSLKETNFRKTVRLKPLTVWCKREKDSRSMKLWKLWESPFVNNVGTYRQNTPALL